MSTTAEPQWATPYHETIADLRRELIESHLEYREQMAPYRAVVSRTKAPAVPAPPVVDAYTGLLMAASYSYTLAAVLERAEKMDPEIARNLASLADCILENGGEEEICADVWPQAQQPETVPAGEPSP